MLWLLILATLILLSVGYVWFTRKIWFFRDPDHSSTPQDDYSIRAPVYGRIVYVNRIENGNVISDKKGESIPIQDVTKEDWPQEFPSGDGWLIGIAMTPLDVHFQYSPLPGKMGGIHHFQHGRNLPMFDLWEYIRITWFRQWVQLWAKKYIFENERQTMWLAGSKAKIGLVLIADKFVDKITTFVKPGDSVPSGGKLSFIERGSQVDLLVCGHPDLQILVKNGDTSKGPNTVLARIPQPE